MWRRSRRIVLPIVLILLIVGVVFGTVSFEIWQHYREVSNAEIARLLGAISQEYPDVDPGVLVGELNQARVGSPQSEGANILRAYGYTAADFVSPSAQEYSHALLATGILAITAFAVMVSGYCWYDARRRRVEVDDLVEYVQKLNNHIYDLRIEANSEDELSLLSNELYKVTVTLKEAAEHDRKIRQNLEIALADISHQLKTPLTSLQVALDNLESEPDMPCAVRQDFLRSSSHQVVTMTSLVTNLLNLAKFDNGTIRMQRHVMSIGEILERVRANLEILADLEDVRLVVDGDLSAWVKLDPRWQSEALSNIVKNCIEYSPAHSTVEITAVDSTLYTRVIIRDHGSGIAPQDLHHIFERFYKASDSSASSVGIGLSFAKSVIEADHGQITAKSRPGLGTTFTITYFH